jgi:hypothetical protein
LLAAICFSITIKARALIEEGDHTGVPVLVRHGPGAWPRAFAARLLPASVLRPLSKLATRRSLYAGSVPGASEEARRVKTMNANWIAGEDGDDGHFELMIVTSDDRRHFAAPSPVAMTALVALAEADTVLVWDPDDRRLIAANLRGTMPWTEDRPPSA